MRFEDRLPQLLERRLFERYLMTYPAQSKRNAVANNYGFKNVMYYV
jgi:hypothetical protein